MSLVYPGNYQLNIHFNETYNNVQTGEHLSFMFPIQKCAEKMRQSITTDFNFV